MKHEKASLIRVKNNFLQYHNNHLGLDEKFKPKIVVIEVSQSLPPNLKVTIPDQSDCCWNWYTVYSGTSLAAVNYLAGKKG
jgi:hypothetical protein